MTLTTVLPFGSCRVFDPLKVLRRHKRLSMPLQDAYWYTHTAGEVLQRIRILTGEIKVPEHLLPFIFEERDPDAKPYTQRKYGPDFFNQFDAFVIELSTMRVFEGEGYRLQMYVIGKEAEARGFDVGQVRAFLRAPADKRLEVAGTVENFDRLSSVFGRFSERFQTAEELRSELDAIKRAMPKPFILVGHFNIPTEKGTLIPERTLLNETLAQWAQANSVPFYDPSSALDNYSWSEAFSDVSHYQTTFIPKVAETFDQLLCRLPSAF